MDAVAFYDKPITKFTRLLTTFCETAPSGFKTFSMAVPAWVKEKGWVSRSIEKELHKAGVSVGKFYFPSTMRPTREARFSLHHFPRPRC